MKILHITNWYPTKHNPFCALWIKRHIDSLPSTQENKVYHVEVKKGKLALRIFRNEDKSRSILIYLPFEVWIIYEFISFLFVALILIKNHRYYQLINFHIAYPNCTYLHLLKNLVKMRPVVITEHWSAYHFDFNINSPHKLSRIRKIFQQNEVIAVSHALADDIERFSGRNLPIHVLPNVVDTGIFNYKYLSQFHDSGNFFMVSQWKLPKNPFVIIEAWPHLVELYPHFILRIGGYGPLQEEMKDAVIRLNMEDHILFLGSLQAVEIAFEMNQSAAFIHCSEYETFSVVCAEALCCGTPIIASNTGGIKELVNPSNGIFIEENNIISFLSSIELFVRSTYDRQLIAYEAHNKFSAKNVGDKYFDILNRIDTR